MIKRWVNGNSDDSGWTITARSCTKASGGNDCFWTWSKQIFAILLILLIPSMGAEKKEPATIIQNKYEIFERANELYRSGKFKKATILYTKSAKRGADPVAIAFNLGNCYYQLEKLTKAAASFRKAVRLSNGENISAIINLAGILFRLEQYGECIAAYRRALKVEPNNPSAWLYLSDAYARTGDLVGSQMALEKAHLQEPGNQSILYQLAEIHVAMKEYDAAIQLIRNVYNINPTEIDYLFYIGDLYRIQQNYENAAVAYREGLSFKPDDYNVLYKLADVLFLDNKPFLAMEYLQKALFAKKDFSDAAIFLGNIAFDQKWWDRAESSYFLSLKAKNKEGLEGIRNLAYEYEGLNQLEKAISILERAQKIFPENKQLKEDADKYRDRQL